MVGHVSPEAQVGGPIALVRDGDNILVDAEQRVINVTNVDDAEWARRRAEWKAPPLKVKNGALRKFAALVQPAELGCVTDLFEDD